jgi:hypothetical protein
METYHINYWKPKSDKLSIVDGVGRKGVCGQFFFAFFFLGFLVDYVGQHGYSDF